jgi:hypothetical protein
MELTTVQQTKVADVVRKVKALRTLTTMTGTRTTRSQGELLQPLTAEELAAAAELLIQDEGQILYGKR